MPLERREGEAEEEIYTFRRRERGGEKFSKGVRERGWGERGGQFS